MNKDLDSLKTRIEKLQRDMSMLNTRMVDVLNQINNFDNRITCKKCLSRNLRVMKDNHIFCRSCGFDSKKEKQK